MNKILYILSLLILSACSAPKNFTLRYRAQDTGLDKLIDIDGCYVSPFGCDSNFFSVYMFYPDGLFTIATATDVSSELVSCFAQGGQSTVCQYPLWGVYAVEGDTIKTQVLRMEGGGCVIFRDYKILPDRSIVNISDYVDPHNTSLGYMANYPSFKANECETRAVFYPLQAKRSKDECPLLKKRWFVKGE
ncbi:hypothetical protein JGH11_19005 [Dysgonomonas sp. Marseille-P4677]|uniref:hypothetical protein n=1 Tax=Dysgonomonas sp. Marseille-P4677 TaxID=2364790 RepID=UPI00191493D0|nr:hypothetical protein [Dysgonomonas sp. Marseille-P4677]MBK5722963.1 hypothetical protein [Dysgonomonas sp. Marseille-P4677]